ncbi:hypothetical protein NQ317_003012 [Molorchus minor]|uniref:Endonuclease/exonuclease/phosphatase domain-containing protein n=1 Tax=Molorchus minor TaxID=1323400 RepID=A0ABQ9ISQ9_9CUCU|nr:hypothetical protein NQ317_003012 [Molorchus minor]
MGKGEGFVWIKIEEIYYYACYISPNVDHNGYESVLIGGDFNAKSPYWGAATTDRHGEALTDLINSIGLTVSNEGDSPTFRRGGSTANIDITMFGEGLRGKIENWRVEDEETLSLHMYISYTVKGGHRNMKEYGRGSLDSGQRKGKRIIRDDPEILRCRNRTELTKKLQKITREASVWTKTDEKDHKNEGTAGTTGEDIEREEESYKNSRNEYKKLIGRAKESCWKKVVEDLESDVWGQGYRIVTKALKVKEPRIDMDEVKTREVMAELFPEKEQERWVAENVTEIKEITQEDFQKVVEKIKEKKAPGLDKIPPEIVKMVATEHGGEVLEILNDMYKKVNLEEWKTAKLVLIPKPGKDLCWRLHTGPYA